MDATAGAAIELEGAEVRLGGRTIWSGLDARVGGGEFVALLGANGAGKSTLLRALLGALPLSGGSARVLGRPAGAANADIGYLPQRRFFDPAIRLRCSDLVRLGLDGDRFGAPWPLPWGPPAERRRRARAAVRDALAMVGATAYSSRPIGECSGGEQQRVLIAQALVRSPRLLLLDEPLDGLDLPNQLAMSALLGEISRREGVSILLVAHDVNPLLPYLDRVIYLAQGQAIEGPVAEVITSESLSRLHRAPVEVLRTSDGRLVVVGAPDVPADHHDHAHDASRPVHAHAG